MLFGRNGRPRPYIKPPFKGCVVVQGPTHPQWLKKVKESWEGYQIIFSTWEGTNAGLYGPSDIVIYNQIPPNAGVKNINLQKVSTINGFLKAKELGWNRALKVRSDFSTTTADGLHSLFDTTKLNLHGYWNNYINDFYMEGEIDDILELFDVGIDEHYPEWHLTKKLYGSKLNTKSNCIVKKLHPKYADLFWLKGNYWFSEHTEKNIVSDVLPEKWNG
jgi:hypothetical protein